MGNYGVPHIVTGSGVGGRSKGQFLPMPKTDQEKFLNGDWVTLDEPETWECFLHGRTEDVFCLHDHSGPTRVVFCAKCFINNMKELGIKDLTKTSSRREEECKG